MGILVYDEIWVREPRLMVPRMMPVGPVRWNESGIAPLPSWMYLLRADQGLRRLAGTKGLAKLTLASGAYTGTKNGQAIYRTDNTRATLDANAPMFATSDGSGTGDFTLLFEMKYDAAADRATAIHNRLNSDVFNSLIVTVNGYYADGATAGTSQSGTIAVSGFDNTSDIKARGVYATSQIDGGTHCWVARRLSGDMSLWRDGIWQATRTHAVVPNIYSTSQAFCLCGWTVDTSSSAPAIIHLATEWDFALPGAFCAELSRDPGQMMVPA